MQNAGIFSCFCLGAQVIQINFWNKELLAAFRILIKGFQSPLNFTLTAQTLHWRTHFPKTVSSERNRILGTRNRFLIISRAALIYNNEFLVSRLTLSHHIRIQHILSTFLNIIIKIFIIIHLSMSSLLLKSATVATKLLLARQKLIFLHVL